MNQNLKIFNNFGVKRGSEYKGLAATKVYNDSDPKIESPVKVINFDQNNALLNVIGTNKYILTSDLSVFEGGLLAESIDYIVDFGAEFDKDCFQKEIDKHEVTYKCGAASALVKAGQREKLNKMKLLFEEISREEGV